MDSRNICSLFENYNRKYFGGKLDKVKLSWSPRMTLCAGKTAYKVWKRGGTSCSIRLSQPLLTQRPHNDTVNTLLHEMIHAYLHVTQGLNYRASHGPEFKSHMKRINSQEGSRITIYHNFEKEVNKYRINVYKCDGPCVSRRPFFGILRRAIERPPGPGDKWWARHQSECGGTFHKIEGPGAISPQGKSAGMNHPKQNYKGPSTLYSAVQSFDNYNSNNANKRTAKMSRKAKFSNRRNPVGATNDNQRETFDEGAILKRIRDKYSDKKQTIMLSKQASEQLNGSRNHGSGYRHPAPFGNYVEGRMNYNYQSHSPGQIKINKYLHRYREATQSFEPHSSKSDKSVPFPIQFSPVVKKQKIPVIKKQKIMSKQASEQLNGGRNRGSGYRHPAPFGNYVEGRMNYNYQSHSPGQIKISKYLCRHREATQSFEPHSSKSGKSLQFPQSNRKSLNSDLKSRNSKLVNKCKENENKRHFNYDYHSKTPSKIRLEKYINRYRVAVACSGSHSSKTSISNISSQSVNVVQARVEKISLKSDVISSPGPSNTTLCPICSIRIPITEYEHHLGECFGNDEFAIDFDESEIESSQSTPSKNDARDSTGSYWEDFSAATNCKNCGSKVLTAELKLHLQYCTDSDSETDFEESPQKLTAGGSKDRLKHSVTDSVDNTFVSCPSCMERVRQENIQEHLDVCLNFIGEEF